MNDITLYSSNISIVDYQGEDPDALIFRWLATKTRGTIRSVRQIELAISTLVRPTLFGMRRSLETPFIKSPYRQILPGSIITPVLVSKLGLLKERECVKTTTSSWLLELKLPVSEE